MKKIVSILLGLILMAESVFSDGCVVQAQTWEEQTDIKTSVEDDTQQSEETASEYEEESKTETTESRTAAESSIEDETGTSKDSGEVTETETAVKSMVTGESTEEAIEEEESETESETEKETAEDGIELKAASDFTQDQAVAWAVGHADNKTKFGTGQCIALTNAYLEYLGHNKVSGNAGEYASKTPPTGWQAIQGAKIQAGDIIIWTGGSTGLGHVAIAVSDNEVVEQNASGKLYCTKNPMVKPGWNRYQQEGYWGVWRPNFGSGSGTPSGGEVSITVKNTGVKDIGETTATLCGQCVKPGANVKIDKCGLYIGTSQSGMSKINTETVSASANAHNNGNSFDIWYNLEQELGYKLTARTTYYYKFYCTYGGKEYCSEVSSFTTTGVNVQVHNGGPYFIAPYNASFRVLCEKAPSDTKLLSVELYLGLNADNMEKVGTHVFSSDENNNKTVEAYFNGVSVMPEKNYYCKYIVHSYAGKAYSSEVKSFTTPANTIFLTSLITCNNEGTETTVRCNCEKAERNEIYTIDFYLGTEENNLALIESREITKELNTSSGGKGFYIDFLVRTQPGKRYYYQFKCVYDFGAKYSGDIFYFTTSAAKEPSISLNTDHISWDTSNSDFTLTAVCDKDADVKLSSVELYIGTDKTNMTKKGAYNVSGQDNTAHENGKKVYPVFEVKGLDEATTYYYQYRCRYNGKEYSSDILQLLTRRSAKIYDTGVIVHFAKDTLFDTVPTELRNCVDQSLYFRCKMVNESDGHYNKFLVLSNGEKRFQMPQSGDWVVDNPNLIVTYLATGGTVSIPTEITLKTSKGEDYQGFKYTQYPEYANEDWTVERVDAGEEAAKIVLNSAGMAEGVQAVKAGVNTFRIVNTQSDTSYVTFTVKVVEEETSSDENSTSVDNSDDDDDDHYYHKAERTDLTALKESEYRISLIQSKEYNGTPYTPSVKLSVYEDGRWKTLTLGTDYRVSYQNNTNASTDNKTAVAIIKGNGSYKGTLRTTFAITPKPISKLKFVACDMSVNDQTPKVYVYDGTTFLKEGIGQDYTLEYDQSLLKSPGKKSITVKADNKNYQGSAEVKINVLDADNVIGMAEIKLDNDSYPYSYGNAVKPKVVSVMIGGKLLDESKDYKVSYNGNKNVGTAYVIVTGKGQYTGRAVKAFTITPDESKLSIGDIKSVTFNGKAQKPTVTVTSAGRKLKAGRDYTITYKNNVHAGTATVIVTGKGNYSLSGSTSKTFTIKRQHIKKASVKVKQGKVILTYGKSTLKEKSQYKDNDYELVYGEVTNGKISVRIIGHGDFEYDIIRKIRI